MGRHLGQRRTVRGLLVGGGLVISLGAASAAWACSPQAETVVVDNLARVAAGTSFEITGSAYEARMVQFREGPGTPWDPDAVLEAARGPVRHRVMGPTFRAQITLDELGWHTLYPFLENADGSPAEQRGQAFSIFVVPHESSPGGSDPTGGGDETDNQIKPIVNQPPITGGHAAGSVPPAPEARQDEQRPVGLPTGKVGRTDARGASAVGDPRTAATTPAVLGGPASASAGAAPTASDDNRPPPPVAHEDLWSGLDPAVAPSLLDERPLPPLDAGWPLGAGVLGLGALMLAGAAAFAGERRLALAGRFRS